MNGVSPAQALMNRRLRTKIPVNKKLLNASVPTHVKESLLKNQSKSEEYYNRTVKPKGNFRLRDLVFVYDLRKSVWVPGQVVGFANVPRSYIVKLDSGQVYQRNSRQLRLRNVGLSNDDLVEYSQAGNSSPIFVPNQNVKGNSPRANPSKLTPNTSPVSPVNQSPANTYSPNVRASPVQSKSPVGVKTPKYVTRSGREIRKPLRFQDDDEYV